MTEDRDIPKSVKASGQRNVIFDSYTTKDVRKTYFRSESIKSIAIIIIVSIGAFAMKGIIISQYGGKEIIIRTLSNPLNIAILAINGLACVGLITRAAWGRIVGIVNCALWVMRFPLWTIFGLWGMFVLIPSSNLFGSNRIQASDIKAEVKWRKDNKIA